MNTPWVGVDLDGTLALTIGNRDENLIGEPIPAMIERVKRWIERGIYVKVFTARMSEQPEVWRVRIGNWTEKHIGTRLESTCTKDYWCVEIWDDIAVRVKRNTGVPISLNVKNSAIGEETE